MSSEDEYSAEGGCSCGAIRYRLTAKALYVHCCHCRWCQRESGASYALNAMIEASCVELLEGETMEVLTPSESGRGQKIHRCPKCFIALWSHYAGAGDKISFVRVGTLDDPDLIPPDIQIYTASKQPWVELSHDMPAVQEYYSRKDYWPEESIERINLAKSS